MSEAEIRKAAPITFINVLILTLLFCIIDITRRAWMVMRPVRRIRDGLDKVMAGDFSTRIQYIKGEDSDNEFDSIIKGINDMVAELAGVETF